MMHNKEDRALVPAIRLSVVCRRGTNENLAHLAGYRLLKEKCRKVERDTTFLYETESAIAPGKAMTLQSLSKMTIPD